MATARTGWMALLLAVALPAGLGLVSSSARAEEVAPSAPPPGSDPGAAEALFASAQAHMRSHDYARALAELNESQRLRPGLGVLLNLAYCHEQLGETATAHGAYLNVAEVARARGEGEREAFARAQAASLVPRLAHLNLTLTSPVAGEAVVVDGRPLGAAGEWAALAHRDLTVDPGEHLVRVTAPAHEGFLAPIVVAAGETRALVVPELAPEAGLSPLNAARSATGAEASDPGAVHAGWMRPVGLVAAGLGVAALAFGVGFNVQAAAAANRADARCRQADGPAICDAAGLGALSDARDARSRALVSYAGGLGLLLGGAALWFAAPSSTPGGARTSFAPAISPGAFGVAARTAF